VFAQQRERGRGTFNGVRTSRKTRIVVHMHPLLPSPPYCSWSQRASRGDERRDRSFRLSVSRADDPADGRGRPQRPTRSKPTGGRLAPLAKRIGPGRAKDAGSARSGPLGLRCTRGPSRTGSSSQPEAGLEWKGAPVRFTVRPFGPPTFARAMYRPCRHAGNKIGGSCRGRGKDLEAHAPACGSRWAPCRSKPKGATEMA
jgi:hypothetical protein